MVYFFQGDDEKYDEQLDMLFKVCHTSNFQTSVQVQFINFIYHFAACLQI